MSSILKALKKLEDEQTGRAASSSGRSGGQFVSPMRAGQPLLLLMFGIGAGLLLAGGLYAVFGRSDVQVSPPVLLQPQNAEIPAVKNVPATDSTVAASVAAVMPPELPAQPASLPVAPPVKPTATVASRPAKIVTPAVVKKQPRSVIVSSGPASPVSAPEAHSDQVEHVQVERREIPSPGQQWAAPRLTVSEILPTSAEGLMAIVNGMPVMEGTMVDGVLVEKIGTDQVVFVVNDRTVVVPLVQPGSVSERQ